MKQVYSDQKCVIAWFKIAEYVNRGEKERALGVYRLLSHSIDDYALSLQLEADILYACNDHRCFDIYHKAALDYLSKNKKTQASVLFEQMLIIKPEMVNIRIKLVALYVEVKNYEGVYSHLKSLIQDYIQQGSFLVAYEHCQAYIKSLSLEYQWNLFLLFLVKIYHQDALIEKLYESIIYTLADIAKVRGELYKEELIRHVGSTLPHFLIRLQNYMQ